MTDKTTRFANESVRTILPRNGIGAARNDVRPTHQVYDLAMIPSRKTSNVYAKQIDKAPNSQVHLLQKPASRFGRKPVSDPFIERLSRLS